METQENYEHGDDGRVQGSISGADTDYLQQAEADTPDIFAGHLDRIVETTLSGCNEVGVKIAILAIVDPRDGTPAVFTIGNTYETAVLCKALLSDLKNKLMQELA